MDNNNGGERELKMFITGFVLGAGGATMSLSPNIDTWGYILIITLMLASVLWMSR